MARRCDRCRSEYQSGADFGGHDYCMTCYNIIKQEAERKLAQQERQQQAKMDMLRHDLHLRYVRESQERERLAREAAEESRQQEMLLQQKKRTQQEGEIHKRKKWPDAKSQYAVEYSAPPQIFTPILRKKKPMLQQQRRAEELPPISLRKAQAAKKPEKQARKAPPKVQEKSAISLSVSSGLPVSLSVGQKQVQILLVGKNSSRSPVPAGIEAKLSDSQKTALQLRLEPRAGTIDPEGESRFKVEFDLPEDCARGRLEFSAVLKENAVYVDREPAKSNPVMLSSQVKSPMDMQYVKASARLESGSLMLEFKNVGESGGVLEASSWLEFSDEKGGPSKAFLSRRTKVKGGQKRIQLQFSPASRLPKEFSISLSGKDSNGKAYSLKQKTNEKEAEASSS